MTDILKANGFNAIGVNAALASGTGAGQARLMVSYVGSTKVATVAKAWAVNPDATTTFALLPAAGVDVATVAGTAPPISAAGYLPVDMERIQGATFTPNAAVTIDPTQAIGDTQTGGTLGAALLAAEAQGVGKWVLDPIALTLTIYRADGITAVKTFNLDSATIPLSRT